ncbi:hypothetical protein VTG60DRAFT_1424 [Thermothelomyces hinnuleus]
MSSGDHLPSGTCSRSRMTTAPTFCPHLPLGTASTATSATWGRASISRSTSSADTFSPPLLMMSLRPAPSTGRRTATSPVLNQGPRPSLASTNSRAVASGLRQ